MSRTRAVVAGVIVVLSLLAAWLDGGENGSWAFHAMRRTKHPKPKSRKNP